MLLDGLVSCGVPDILEPHRHRLRLRILVHLPLADETGLDAATAAGLRARERAALHLATTVIATSDAAARRISEMHDISRCRVCRARRRSRSPGHAGSDRPPAALRRLGHSA